MPLDTEKFIKEVEKRPSLWNNHSTAFNNKSLKTKSWKELCDIFVSNYPAMDPAAKNREAIALQRKWKSLRDSFNRELKARRLDNKTPEDPGCILCPYFEQLSFLRPILEAKMRDTIRESQVEHHREQGTPDIEIISSKKRKRSVTHVLDDSPDSTEEGNVLDSDLQFFHSLLPYLRRLPPKNKLDLKTAFMGLIKKYSRRKIIPQVVNGTEGSSRTTPAVLNVSTESQGNGEEENDEDEDESGEEEEEVDAEEVEEEEEKSDVATSDTSPGLSTGYTDAESS